MSEPSYTLVRADGTRIPIPPTGLRLGRKGDNDVVVNGSNISRYHARILVAAGKCWIRDENSALGTLLNGQLVPGQIEFKPGDTLHLGAEAFYLEQVAPAPAISPVVEASPAPAAAPRRRLKPAVGIGLAIGLVAILLVVAYVSGLFGGGGFGTGGVQYTRFEDPNDLYSIEHPSSWVVEEAFDFDVYSLSFRNPGWEDDEQGVIVMASPLYGADILFSTDFLSPEDLLEFLVLSGQLLGLEESFPDTDVRTQSIGGNPAAVFETSFDDGANSYHTQVACVLSDENFVLFIAAFPEDSWKANRGIIEHMLGSLRLE